MKEELKLLGLNDVDIKIYLTLLELGESLASQIAHKAEIPRASVYDVLERLEQEGLVSHIVKDFKKYFIAASPKTIITNLEYKKEKIKDILPELEEIKYKLTTEKTKTEVYEGKKGIQTILNLMLEEKELFVMGASRKSPEVLPYFIGKWHKERIKRKIKVKILYNDTKIIRKALKKAKEFLGIRKGWDYKFLHVTYLSPIMTIVFGNKVALVSWLKTPSAILIESKDIAETYKQYMLSLWQIAKKSETLSPKTYELDKSIKSAKPIELPRIDKGIYMFKTFAFGERGTKIDKKLLNEIISGMESSINSNFKDFDYILSPEPGGHTWGMLISLRLNKNINILRREPSKLKGELKVSRITGYYKHNLYFNHFKKGDKVLIVDDVVSTGGTLKTILKTLKSIGVKPMGVQVIFAKSDDYKEIEKEFNVPIKFLKK